ncbi:MAG: pilus assembly protein [Roseburia sp.]|nr:pilus assembly protein [Roseburia sp.]
MRWCKGSFTVEAAVVFPIVLLCICSVIILGTELCDEVDITAEQYGKSETIDLIQSMYRREIIEDLLGEEYEY